HGTAAVEATGRTPPPPACGEDRPCEGGNKPLPSYVPVTYQQAAYHLPVYAAIPGVSVARSRLGIPIEATARRTRRPAASAAALPRRHRHPPRCRAGRPATRCRPAPDR